MEITSHCNASCNYCPCTVYRDLWPKNHMSIEVFNKIPPAFKNAQIVYLQGWREPFLHPNIFEMIDVAKKPGSTVGTQPMARC